MPLARCPDCNMTSHLGCRTCGGTGRVRTRRDANPWPRHMRKNRHNAPSKGGCDHLVVAAIAGAAGLVDVAARLTEVLA